MRKGFTLTELLVVVLIITVLASLLFPAFSGAKSKAHETACVSNIRQIHAALTLYHADYDEYPPNNLGWPGLKPYYPTLLRCSVTPPDEHINFSYLIYGSFPGPPINKAEAEINDRFIQCRDARGSAFPLVYDFNHRNLPEAYATGRQFILIGRVDGSVQSISSKSAQSRLRDEPSLPCSRPPIPEMNL
ncbi:hypothetical protein BH11ARM2_BH11ARM2_21070 [soil metagenome]